MNGLRLILIAAALVGPGSASLGQARPEVVVWAIPAARTYHCPGSRWFGRGQGTRMPECQAVRSGIRPALGVGCGPPCD